jgi:hypothetical protein
MGFDHYYISPDNNPISADHYSMASDNYLHTHDASVV